LQTADRSRWNKGVGGVGDRESRERKRDESPFPAAGRGGGH